jgi:hypothetical protein
MEDGVDCEALLREAEQAEEARAIAARLPRPPTHLPNGKKEEESGAPGVAGSVEGKLCGRSSCVHMEM